MIATSANFSGRTPLISGVDIFGGYTPGSYIYAPETQESILYVVIADTLTAPVLVHGFTIEAVASSTPSPQRRP